MTIIMTDELRKVFEKQIADYYGTENRLFLLMEESGELIQASSKMVRMLNKPDNTREERHTSVGHLIEEIADVKCLLDEVLYLLGYDWKDVELTMDKKLDRTNQIIVNEWQVKHSKKGELNNEE